MPSFRALFRLKQRANSTPPATRHTWHGLRRSQSAVAPLTQEPQPTAISEDIRTPIEEDGVNDLASYQDTDDQRDDSSHEPLERQSPNVPTSVPTRESNDGSDRSGSDSQRGYQREPQGGSGRLKGLISRLRLGRSQDRSSASESAQPTIPLPQSGAIDPMTTDPVKKDLHPQNSSTVECEVQEQRNASAQTVLSQESNQTTATVNRHPSQRIPVSIEELEDGVFWSSLLDFDKDNNHVPEASDPFSDGKNIESRHQPGASSRYSDRNQRQSESSAHSRVGIERQSSFKSHTSHHFVLNTTRVSSCSSHASRGSRLSRVDPSQAAMRFDVLAAELKLAISIQGDEPAIPKSEEEKQEETRRRTRFGRMRPSQSNQTLGEVSYPISKLRRTKTFANLGRRSSPMSSLRGNACTIETAGMHRGDGSILANVWFVILHTSWCASLTRVPAGPHSTELFIEPGDMKAATRLYDHFANQVLLAERDADKIALTTRVVALPHVESESNAAAVLSVGWVFKEILAGFPGGILGSVRLFQVLYSIYLACPAHTGCIQLIALAIMALTGEMQCALICAVFGLLASLLQKTENMEEEPSTHPGNLVRPVASPLQCDELVRVFGPLLIGGLDRDRAAQRSVEQEVEEQRVVGLLIGQWRGVSRQLREWKGDSRTGK
ncbi:hypothetical protein N7451_003956 [Penicillium sp. IBT 35674x]|nr:hypothetical protein N7451_003956 [Penicillium sp. IBT 35674x]